MTETTTASVRRGLSGRRTGAKQMYLLGRYPILVGPHSYLATESERLAGLRWKYFEAQRLAPTVGAEITGVDLAQSLSDEVIDELRQALHDYKVIFFRDQPLTTDQHIAFARRFGELEHHPFLPSNTIDPELVRFEKGENLAGTENVWHHDVTWRKCPSFGAMLRSLEVPQTGGDTLFCDMYAAYDSLDDDLKATIDGIYAIHDFSYSFGRSMSEEERTKAQQVYPPVRHPVVCIHEVTRKRHLYVNRVFVDHIEGMDTDQSTALLDRLCRQTDYPELQCRFRWTPNAIAFWDNRAVQHYAASDYWPQTRIMERASIIGTEPTGS